MSAIEGAHEAYATAVEAQRQAGERVRDAELAARTAKRARKNIAAEMTADEVRKVIVDDETASEMLAAAQRAAEDARINVIAATNRIQQAERDERHRLQHERGVLPILEVQREIEPLQAKIDQLRATQNALFLREVAPRNDPYEPTTMFDRPGAHTFVNVNHILTSQTPPPPAPEPLPPSTLAPKSGKPFTQDERLDLLFCLDERAGAVVGDAQVDASFPVPDLYATCGDFRFGGTPIRDAEFFAQMRGAGGRGGLKRAVNIATSVRGIAPTHEWAQRRLGQVRGWVKPTAPLLDDGRPAIGADGTIREPYAQSSNGRA